MRTLTLTLEEHDGEQIHRVSKRYTIRELENLPWPSVATLLHAACSELTEKLDAALAVEDEAK